MDLLYASILSKGISDTSKSFHAMKSGLVSFHVGQKACCYARKLKYIILMKIVLTRIERPTPGSYDL